MTTATAPVSAVVAVLEAETAQAVSAAEAAEAAALAAIAAAHELEAENTRRAALEVSSIKETTQENEDRLTWLTTQITEIRTQIMATETQILEIRELLKPLQVIPVVTIPEGLEQSTPVTEQSSAGAVDPLEAENPNPLQRQSAPAKAEKRHKML